jgi:hypothetical protein
MAPKISFTKIHISGNGNHTFIVSGETGLYVNQGTDFWRKRDMPVTIAIVMCFK